MYHEHSRKAFVLAAAALTLLLLVNACGAAEAPTPTKAPAVAASPTPAATPTPVLPKKGGTLRYIHQSNPLAMDVLQTISSADTTYMAPIYDGFIMVEPDRSFSPAQARSWDVLDGGKTIVLHIAPGIKFHDGTPFNAAAVKSDFDYKLNPDNQFEQRPQMTVISSVEAIGEYDLKLNLKQTDALVMPNMGARAGWVFSPTARDAVAKADRKMKPVGAGSFKFVDILIDSHLTMERWPNGFGGGKYPYVDTLKYLFIADPAVQLATYRAGEVDAYQAYNDQLPTLRADKTTVLVPRWRTEWGFLMVNPRFKPLDDVRVRKAMSLAIDREAIVKAFLAGEGTALYGVIGAAWSWCYDPTYKKYGFNPEEAKKLLTEAGYSQGFKVSPTTWFGKESRLPLLNLLADQMKQVGITLDLVMMESIQASRQFSFDKTLAAYSSEWGTGAPDLHTHMGDLFDSTNPRYMFGQGYLDAAVVKQLDEALAKGRGTLEPKDRCGYYRQAQEIINDYMLGISLFTGRVSMAHRDYVKNYQEFPSGGGSQWFKVWLDK
ncbi:MAG: ABC transporter substrate-binding protein [Chloroflexi bacterium]|nr:ABC transporter substrate-binding protein [Chloroflexota bacterium]